MPGTGRFVRLAAAIVLLSTAACSSGAVETTTSTATTSTTTTADQVTAAGPLTEEVTFTSNEFELVGDLEVPDGPGPHPAVILVHGSGSQTRYSTPTSGLVRDAFVDAGYAVLTWDKPGSGESTGEFDEGHTLTQRAEILVSGIELLKDRDEIDDARVGVWGLSQAGWVMPLAMTMTDDIAFMIVVSGGAEDSIEQMVFQWTQRAICRGASDAEVDLMNTHGPLALKAEVYADYRRAMEQVLTIADIDRYVGVDVELAEEDEWVPWPREIDAFFDPVAVLEQTTIPVLAIFGEHDSQIDPVQGAQAYQAALERAGNADFRVETIRGASHIMRPTAGPCGSEPTGIADEYLALIDEWLVSHPADDLVDR